MPSYKSIKGRQLKLKQSIRHSVSVFFAIWPKKEVRHQLCDLSEKLELVCGGAKIPADNIHLTLIFLGMVEVSDLNQLFLIANKVKGSTFNFKVNGVSYWQRNRIVYARTDMVPMQLQNLVRSLKGVLSANGFISDQRTFIPHITLVKKAQPCILPNSLISLERPIDWPVHEWLLVKSDRGDSGRRVYNIINRWPMEHYR